jgi:hypothetical protein
MPYAQPVWGDWVEIQNNCTLAPTNVTNMSSPLNPVSPINPGNLEVPATVTETAPAGQEITVMQTLVNTPTVPQTTPSSESTSTTSTQQEVPKGKTLVPGFGLVMSLEILNTPAIQQEQTLNTLLEYQQELPYELRGNQDLLLEFITYNDVGITFDRDTRARWNSLLRYNEVQPGY